MGPFKGTINIKNLIILLCFLPVFNCSPQETTTINPGIYIPELYGDDLGKYVPDDSGKYYHTDLPYDGGYGDTGIKYVHDADGNMVPISTRRWTRNDHLRFMLDFNFGKNGLQIVNLEWTRDGDKNYNFKYINENPLFTNNEDAAEDSYSDNNYNKGYNYFYNNDGTNTDSQHLQQAIREVIYHIENNILPNL